MDLWNTFENAKQVPDFSKSRQQIRVRNRIDTSLDKIEYANRELQLAEAATFTYSDEKRYISASNVTFELLVSVYDVNSRTMLAMRLAQPMSEDELKAIKAFVLRRRNPNIETRLIGMQSSGTNISAMLFSANQIRKAVGGNLMEVDLFGGNVRHIAFDTRTGLSYDLLMQNKIYGPHELENALTWAEFATKVSKLKFV